MQSIAIFPCCYTGEATIIGELCYLLKGRVVTDEMLIADVAEQFDVSPADMKKSLFGTHTSFSCHRPTKSSYLNLLKFVIERRLLSHRGAAIHFGLHTSLLPVNNIAFIKILVIDGMQSRIERAMQLEGLKEKTARRYINRKDRIAMQWTHFLFGVEPFDRSLHDMVILCGKKRPRSIAKMIIACAERKDGHDFSGGVLLQPAMSRHLQDANL